MIEKGLLGYWRPRKYVCLGGRKRQISGILLQWIWWESYEWEALCIWSRKICKLTGTYRSRARLQGTVRSMLLCPGLQVGVLRCKASWSGVFREEALSTTCSVWEALESEPLTLGQKTAAVHCAAAKMPRDPDDDRDFVVQSWDTW